VLNLISKLVKDESGQDLAEYAIALAVIAVGVGLVVSTLGNTVKGMWTNANSQLTTISN